MKELLPLANPCDFVLGGWDISRENLYVSCKRARVLEPDLIRQLKGELEQIVPMPAALNKDYIATNQSDRNDNALFDTNVEIIKKLRQDI